MSEHEEYKYAELVDEIERLRAALKDAIRMLEERGVHDGNPGMEQYDDYKKLCVLVADLNRPRSK